MALFIFFRARGGAVPRLCRLPLAHAASFWLLLFIAAVPTRAESPDDSTRAVTALRVNQPPQIDGHLSEPAWQKAEVAGNFFRAQQNRGMPARLRTEAFVLYDAVAIYVGFRCWEPDMTGLRETLTRRDTRIWDDDAVEVVLDTYHDDRNAYVFGINTLATQMDQRISNESSFSFAWDASWEAEVQKYADHWTAEFAIPLAELQYDKEGTTWGVNFWRAHPIDQESYSWSDTGGDFGRISEFGELRGLQLTTVTTETGRLAFLPYASYRALEGRPDDGDAGIDLIYQPSASLIGNLTVFPDFSQLESDPTLINVNDERELSLPERRPFFRDGAELFDLPLRLFYTRRVQEIDLGVKGTGKVGGYTWAAVNTYGKLIDRYDGDAKRRANLVNLRLNRDIGERTVIGAMAVHKHQSDRDVGLLSLNSRLGLGRDWTATGQFVGNSTGNSPHYAYHVSTEWRNQSGLSGFVELEEIRDGFRPNETGLEDEAYRRARGSFTFLNEYSEGSTLNALVLRGRVFRQTDETGRLREQYAQAEGSFDVGRFDFYSLARVGQLREAGRLWNTRFTGADLEYTSTWGFVGIYNQIGSRQGIFNWFVSLDANANLFSRLTISLAAHRFDWRDRRETLVMRTTTNYQFTRHVGLRLFHERVIEQTDGTTKDNFNTVFDYEFTPESHFFLVFVRDRDRTKAAFSKIAYLFGGI
ncbi:MAG: carbohydrate binding family 9 domain-containing protein [Gemmatimonadetes bacterium]|nr:carbohydrate binding family 9 domain-containing protein [Gemmatimonadota bacterium]